MNENIIELKSCPFCGQKPDYNAEEPYTFTYICGWVSETSLSCCITMKEPYGENRNNDGLCATEEEAKAILMDRWNKRI